MCNKEAKSNNPGAENTLTSGSDYLFWYIICPPVNRYLASVSGVSTYRRINCT